MVCLHTMCTQLSLTHTTECSVVMSPGLIYLRPVIHSSCVSPRENLRISVANVKLCDLEGTEQQQPLLQWAVEARVWT